MFVNCRTYVKTNAMVMLFSLLCTMSNVSPNDRLLGQNEALAFIHGIFRCGLHNFRIVSPPSIVFNSGSLNGGESVQDGGSSSVTMEPPDWIPIETAENILLSAFSKLSADQKQGFRVRVEEVAQTSSSTSTLSSSYTHIEAGAFLLLALTEWKRYVVQHMNEMKMVCCTLNDEMQHFEKFSQIDAIANVLHKSEISYLNDDVCVIFRRFCSTEKRHSEKKVGGTGRGLGTSQKNLAEDRISDRLAAACFPVLACEPLTELQGLEKSAVEPFKISPNPAQSYEFLMSSWSGYREQCRELLEELQRIGKNNDIQTESFSCRSSAVSPRSSSREVLYLSSSTSPNRLSSQDVAQHEAVYLLFIERLERLHDMFRKDRAALAGNASGSSSSKRNSSIGISVDGSLSLVDEMHSRVVMVKETWKIFRQVLLGFIKLRSLASLGNGTLPDEWSQHK